MDPPEDEAASSSVVVGNYVEKHELVPELRFPPGFHFQPTELTLVDFYLRAKIEGRELPIHVINEVDLLKWQPGELVEAYKGYGESKWYFYWKRVASSSNKEQEPNRQVHLPGLRGTWKATGSLIMIRRRGKDGKPAGAVVGTKRVLIYHSTDPEEDGNWSMHEYILTSYSQIGQYALYSVQRKQQSDTEPKTGGEGEATGTNMEPGTGETTKMRKRAAPGKNRKRRKAATAQQDMPLQPPLTPLIQDRQTLPQELLLPPSAHTPMSLPSVPLQQQQGYGNQQLLGISAPVGAGHASQPCWSYDIAAQSSMPQTFCNQLQGEQPQGHMWDHQYSSNEIDAGQYHQLYQQQENHVQWFGALDQDVYTGQYLQQESGFFSDSTTQNNSIWDWELGVEDHPYYQQGVEDQQHAYAYAFQSYDDPQGHGSVFAPQVASCGSHEQFTTGADGGAVASEVDDNMASLFPDGDLFSHLDLLLFGAEDESNSALQGHQELQMPCEQQQQTDDNNAGEPLDFGSGGVTTTRDGTL